MHSLKSLVGLLLPFLQLGTAGLATRQNTCVSQSQPDPIVNQYPGEITGTINGTLAVLPITLEIAKTIVPSQYNILTGAIAQAFPAFKGTTAYPMIIQAVIDHDDQESGFMVGDFSRFSVFMPFIDLLHDGHTSFTYIAGATLSASNAVAIAGANTYGPPYVTPANFNPPCDAYVFVNNCHTGNTTFSSWNAATGALTGSLNFMPYSHTPYSLATMRNITNQPLFGSGQSCDNYITLWNTTLTQGKYVPKPVIGNVMLAPPLYPENTTFYGVSGFQVDLAFVERGDVPCQSLQGYSGTGSGD